MSETKKREFDYEAFMVENLAHIETSRKDRRITMFKIFLALGMFLTDIYSSDKANADYNGAFVMCPIVGKKFMFKACLPFEDDLDYKQRLAAFCLERATEQKEELVKRYKFKEETIRGFDKLLKLIENSVNLEPREFALEYERIMVSLTEKRESGKDYKLDEVFSTQVRHCNFMNSKNLFSSRLFRVGAELAKKQYHNIITSYNGMSLHGRLAMKMLHDSYESGNNNDQGTDYLQDVMGISK